MLNRWISAVSNRFDAGFSPDPVDWRTIGREAEYPVVLANGEAADIKALWPLLTQSAEKDGVQFKVSKEGDMVVMLEGPQFSFAAEVGKGTIEVITEPAQDLNELADWHESAMKHLLWATGQQGWHVLGYGIQPCTPATPDLMSPKKRYGVLLETIGELWLWFTLTASDQIQVDLSREELIPTTNLCNLLAPVTVALTANSPIFDGQYSGACSAREQRMGEIGTAHGRHGMPTRPARSTEDFVSSLIRQPHLMKRTNGVLGPATGTFADHIQKHGADVGAPEGELFAQIFSDYLLHEHYIWNSARPRSAHGTLELRAACQQPWSEHMAAAALGLGLVEAAAPLSRYVHETLGDGAWNRCTQWHAAVIRRGLAAPPPVDNFIQDILSLCKRGLVRRGRGEERFLAPLESRVNAHTNPAQSAKRAFDAGGMAALIAHTQCNPNTHL